MTVSECGYKLTGEFLAERLNGVLRGNRIFNVEVGRVEFELEKFGLKFSRSGKSYDANCKICGVVNGKDWGTCSKEKHDKYYAQFEEAS